MRKVSRRWRRILPERVPEPGKEWRERPWLHFAYGPHGSEAFIAHFWHYMHEGLIYRGRRKLIKCGRLKGLQFLLSKAYRYGQINDIQSLFWLAEIYKQHHILRWLEAELERRRPGTIHIHEAVMDARLLF